MSQLNNIFSNIKHKNNGKYFFIKYDVDLNLETKLLFIFFMNSLSLAFSIFIVSNSKIITLQWLHVLNLQGLIA